MERWHFRPELRVRHLKVFLLLSCSPAPLLCFLLPAKNGGGEIRTHETLTGPPVFKTDRPDALNADASDSYANAADCLGVLLGAARRVDPELASVIAAWQKLAPAIRAGILAMITVSRNTINPR